jgi:hypothetical protein
MDDRKWWITLLETPSGFALFAVNEYALKETDVSNSIPFLHLFCHFLLPLDLETSDKSHMLCHLSLQDIWVYFRNVRTAMEVRSVILDNSVCTKSLLFLLRNLMFVFDASTGYGSLWFCGVC